MSSTTIVFFNSTHAWGGGEKWHLDIARKTQVDGYNVFVVAEKKSRLFQRAKQQAIRCIGIHVTNLSFLNPWKIFTVYRLLKKVQATTIIMNSPADVKLAGVAARMAGVKKIIYRRGSAIPIKNSFLNRFLFTYVITDIIANSEETRNTILQNNKHLFDAKKILVIYNGIDLPEYDAIDAPLLYQRSGNELILGNAGRFVEQKGQHYLIDLALALKNKGVAFKLLFAGEGKLMAEIQALAKKKGVEDRVVFLGFVKNIKSFMQSIDIFLLSSLWEGFGYVLVEAMACGKPIVAFRNSSNPEIVAENISGYLADPYDMKQYAAYVYDLCSSLELRRSMGYAGRKRVEQLYSIEKTYINFKEAFLQ